MPSPRSDKPSDIVESVMHSAHTRNPGSLVLHHGSLLRLTILGEADALRPGTLKTRDRGAVVLLTPRCWLGPNETLEHAWPGFPHINELLKSGASAGHAFGAKGYARFQNRLLILPRVPWFIVPGEIRHALPGHTRWWGIEIYRFYAMEYGGTSRPRLGLYGLFIEFLPCPYQLPPRKWLGLPHVWRLVGRHHRYHTYLTTGEVMRGTDRLIRSLAVMAGVVAAAGSVVIAHVALLLHRDRQRSLETG